MFEGPGTANILVTIVASVTGNPDLHVLHSTCTCTAYSIIHVVQYPGIHIHTYNVHHTLIQAYRVHFTTIYIHDKCNLHKPNIIFFNASTFSSAVGSLLLLLLHVLVPPPPPSTTFSTTLEFSSRPCPSSSIFNAAINSGWFA